MNEHFLTYEQSVAVKELGFDDPCMGYFQYDIEKKYAPEFYYHKPNVDCSWNPLCKNSLHPKEIETNAPKVSAPLKSQFFKWVREKYKIYSYIKIRIENYEFHYYEYIILDYPFRNEFQTYEQAEDACINKIIVLLKEAK